MGKKIVIALGGNALGNNLPEQMAAVKETAKAIVDLIEEGNEVVISHGNGPQVGMINLAMGELAKVDPGNPVAPLSVCVAMSQGYIGYDLQNAIREELLDRGIQKPVSSIITQMRVDPEDAAFQIAADTLVERGGLAGLHVMGSRWRDAISPARRAGRQRRRW